MDKFHRDSREGHVSDERVQKYPAHTPRLGYVGLGNMGGALATRLKSQFPLTVFDLNPKALAPFEKIGAFACASLVEFADRVDIVFLCLPTSGHVSEVLFGEPALADHLRPGTIVVDQSTSDPVETMETAEALGQRSIRMVDAPVSGGKKGAESGQITIMVGADDETFVTVEPFLRAISTSLYHIGGIGAGHTMKLVNNLVSATQRLVALEAVALAAKNGLDLARVQEVLASGGARSPFVEGPLRALIEASDLGANFSLGLMAKDVRLACKLGESTDVPLPFGNTAQQLYDRGIELRGPEDRVNAMVHVVAQLADTQIVGASGKKAASDHSTIVDDTSHR